MWSILLCGDELLLVPSFRIALTCAAPKRVERMGGKGWTDEDLPFIYADCRVKFDVAGLVMFEMYRIEL